MVFQFICSAKSGRQIVFWFSVLHEKGDISITIDFAPRLPSLFNEDDTLLPCEHRHHCHHHFHITFWLQHKFNVLKISRKQSSEVCNKFSYNGQTEGMSKRILWTKFDPDFLCYFPDSAQKGHNSEMWNRNFKRPSNFLWNKFSLTKSLFQIPFSYGRSKFSFMWIKHTNSLNQYHP